LNSKYQEATIPWSMLFGSLLNTLDYPFSLNHPYYYEENWRKEYEYVLAFSADKIEDVTQRYMLQWEDTQQRNLITKKNVIDFPKVYSEI
jgi:hypothetical protein